MQPKLILLTGATGYVGGRLLAALEQRGDCVRCLARRPENVRRTTAEVVPGDLFDVGSLARALTGVQTAYYLVHSMGSAGDFEKQDRQAAENFGTAASVAGVQRIIYLGGLGDDRAGLSPHLRSRHEVGEVLRASGVPVTELRASIIIGSGSLSFEMIRALVERLPVMITPRWVNVPAQPIAIEDVVAYLIVAPTVTAGIYEIGGPDIVSYADLMREYARQRGLRRVMIPVPVLTPYVSSLWLGLVTPLFARIGRKLIDSIRHSTVVRDDTARRAFPIQPVGVREAMARALRNEDRESHWADAAGAVPHWGGVRFGNRLVDQRSVTVPVSPAAAFAPIRRIGGATGWYFATWLWRLRGALDLLFGGVGMRRGRRDADRLRVGDVVDCWRVEVIEPDRRLRLYAEMKLPGRAWLEFVVEPTATGTRITQTATFDPVGLFGLLYWYSVWPLHELVFRGMLRGVASMAAVDQSQGGPSVPARR